MNEQRKMKTLFITQKSDPLKENWDNLLAHMQSLLKMACSLCREDIINSVERQIVVLMKNKPNKKIYRSILNSVNKIELELNYDGHEER